MRESAVLVQGLGWHCRICFVEAEEPSQLLLALTWIGFDVKGSCTESPKPAGVPVARAAGGSAHIRSVTCWQWWCWMLLFWPWGFKTLCRTRSYELQGARVGISWICAPPRECPLSLSLLLKSRGNLAGDVICWCLFRAHVPHFCPDAVSVLLLPQVDDLVTVYLFWGEVLCNCWEQHKMGKTWIYEHFTSILLCGLDLGFLEYRFGVCLI